MSSSIKRGVAVAGSAAVIAVLGLGGVMSANADTTTPTNPSSSQVEQSDGDGEVADDDANVGPDADPNEAGHQDAVNDDPAE